MRAPLARLLIALTLLLVAGTLSAAERPPQNLHLVGDHWTAWTPPTSFPEGAKTYTVVKGDTLWDLAAKFYGNAYLWPQLWERNQYVVDSHWIYPGDPLLVDVEVAKAETLSQVGQPPGTGTAETPAAGEGANPAESGVPGAESAEIAAGPPVPLGVESDIYCSGFIGEIDESFGYSIIGSEYESLSPRLVGPPGKHLEGIYGTVDTVKYDLSVGDIVYLDGGRSGGLSPGMVFTAVAPEDEVRHPVHQNLIGRFYRYLGQVRVLSVQDQSGIGEIIQSCDPIRVGTKLKPFEQEPVPLGRRTRMRPYNLPTSAESLADAPVILRSDRNLVSLGQDHVVFIDRGAEDNVTPGDLYTVYRMNQRPNLPPIVLGEVAVLSVHRRSSVARILESRYTIYAGDRLAPK